jgi:PAS domain S-box-containing protein
LRLSVRFLRDYHFWIILLIFAACVFLHYPEVVPISAKLGFHSLIGLERHALIRILFLVPIAYAAYVYGVTAGLVTLFASLAAMLPRIFFISPYPKDALFETITAFVIGALINSWLEFRRREIGRREQTILKLESVRSELQRIGRRFQEIFEKAHDAIWIQDLSGSIVTANKACSRLTGYSRKELTKMVVYEFFTDDCLERAEQVKESLLSGQEVKQPYEQRIIKKNGSEAVIMLTTSLLGEEGSSGSSALLHIARDISEEQKLRESLQLYTEQIGRAHEEERKRIARELHDDTIQTMVAVSRRLDNFIAQHSRMKKESFRSLESIQREIDESLVRIRSFVQYLRPPILEYLGLGPALNELANQIHSESGIRVKMQIEDCEQNWSSEEKLLIYRVIQEALRNVWKHAEATEAAVSAQFDGQGAVFSISDDGKGFELESDSDLLIKGKLGLMGMRERAHLIGGTLKIEARPNRGTEVTLIIPRGRSIR